MGDFNSPASVRGEGYDLVRVSGFKDTWDLAEKKDAGFTAPPKIDGWKEAEGKSPEQGMRIDYIWHWGDINIEESRVLCNGKRELSSFGSLCGDDQNRYIEPLQQALKTGKEERK